MSSAPSAAAQRPDLAALRGRLSEVESENVQLKTQLAWFKRQLFGSKSEKRTMLDPAVQSDLLAALGQAAEALPEPPTEKITYTRRKKGRGEAVNDSGLRFDDTVPVETIYLEAPELADMPADEQVMISEKVSFRLAQRPGSYVILKYVRPTIKYADQLITPPAPANVLDKSAVDVSLLAGMLVDKFTYHLPLYRQHQRLKHSGIDVSRASLTNWAKRSIDLLRPVFDAQTRHILQSKVLAMDETPIKAGRQGKGKLHRGYLWPLYGEADEIAFHYSPSRAARVVEALLGETFQGVLLSDGYEAYERYARRRPEVTHAQCWAHTRRYFERASDAEPQAAAAGLELIGALYRHEAHIREANLTGEAKLSYRTQHSGPMVRALWCWCDAQCQRPELLPSSPLSKALKYARARTDSLMVFLSDPDVPIDTNHLERALRPIPMGRKAWLFCWTELGARHVGVIQSLLVTCRLHGINPYTYLVDVLQRIDRHPASQVMELTPRLWKQHFADNPLRSDLDARS